MNKQFRQYINIFDVRMVYKMLYIQKDPDVVAHYNQMSNLKQRLAAGELDISNEDNPMLCFSTQVKEIESVEDLIYRLSNTYMTMSVQDNPYSETMALPLNDKFAHISILMKYIATLNRLSNHYDNKSYEATETALQGLSTKINIDTLKQFNDVAWTKIPIEGPGVIKYDMSIYNELIEQVEANLTKVKEAYESRREEGVLL